MRQAAVASRADHPVVLNGFSRLAGGGTLRAQLVHNFPRTRVESRYFPLENAMANRLLTAALLLATSGLFSGLLGACAHQEYFPSSTIPKTDENKQIIETVEQYRRRLLERNVEGLLVLASEKYFEDSGTPRSDDDYGYDGLKMVLSKRLSRVQSMRYEIEYRAIKHAGNRAEVEVFLDGSFELSAKSGDRYRRVNDYHRFILEHSQTDEKWRFISGM
jgi:hypothetical protein